jgi:xylulokinase
MLDPSGRRLAEFAAPYPTRRPVPGRAEQEPEDWLRLVRAALERFAGVGGPVAAICVTSQVNTHVFVDADLAVLHPAIVWQDGRAAAAGAAVETQGERGGQDPLAGRADPGGCKSRLGADGVDAGAHPDLWARTAHVLLPRDWIVARLTGCWSVIRCPRSGWCRRGWPMPTP